MSDVATAGDRGATQLEITGRVLAEFANYNGLWSAIRGRRDEMKITLEELDNLTGLPDRYCAKILGPGQIRKLGLSSLDTILGAIGCKLVLIEDPVATAKMLARAEKQRRPLRQLKLLQRPDPNR